MVSTICCHAVGTGWLIILIKNSLNYNSLKFTRKKEGDEAALKILHEFREDCLRILGKQEQAVHDCGPIESKDRQRGKREQEGESKKRE